MNTNNEKYQYNGAGTQNYNLIIDKRIAVDKSTMDNETFLEICKFVERMKDANKK